MPEQSVLIAAGGTGGHVYPALTVAKALRELDIPVCWVGTERGIESRVVTAAKLELLKINVRALRGKGLLAKFSALISVLFAIASSIRIVLQKKPATVLGMGGYVSGPVCLAARLCGRRVVLHEQNAVSGFTNRILARFANRILEAVPGTIANSARVVHTGNPVRSEIAALEHPSSRLAARRGPVRILVLGGSQGALALNSGLPGQLSKLETPLDVLHQAGAKRTDETCNCYDGFSGKVTVVEFIEDMAGAYAWADLVICRSGAMTVAELAAAGCASVLVPFPHAVDDHQTANGRFLEAADAAVIVQESALTEPDSKQLIGELCTDRKRLQRMAINARSVARVDATNLIVKELLSVTS